MLAKSRTFFSTNGLTVWQSIQPYFTLWRSTRDILLTVGSIFWFFLCTYIVCMANSAVDKINPNNLRPPQDREVLHDPLLHWSMRVFVDTGLPRNLSDIWVQCATALLFIRAVTMKRLSMTVLRRILFIAGIVYLIRAPTVLLTVLPNPYIECISNPHPNIFVDALDLMLQRRYSCGDVFFSGHSIFITLVARVYVMYSSYIFIHILAWLFTLGGLFSLVFTTYHYTIDVIFAFTIVTTLFSIWHWCAKGKMGLGRWWGHVLLYLDGERMMDQEEQNGHIPYAVDRFIPNASSAMPLTEIRPSVSSKPTETPFIIPITDPALPLHQGDNSFTSQSSSSISASSSTSPRRRGKSPGPPDSSRSHRA